MLSGLLFALFDFGENRTGYHARGLDATGRETGPVVEVDDGKVALGVDDGVAAIDAYVEYVGRAVAGVAKLVDVKSRLLASPTRGLVIDF